MIRNTSEWVDAGKGKLGEKNKMMSGRAMAAYSFLMCYCSS